MSSASDHGTLYQLRSLAQRRNVGKKPKKDFNAHDDFFNLVITSHILAAAMEVLGMDALDDDPCEELIPPNVDSLSKSERSELLQHIVGVILDAYVDLNHSVSESKDDDTSTNNEEDANKHEDADNRNDDNVQMYALTLGLIYSEFADGIREEDGE